ncbi:MAG: hypothetical protein AAGC46_01685 [Solirubrobacteraceae bacterium]|nr:hypothetical protein [Patulibacter sp.]
MSPRFRRPSAAPAAIAALAVGALAAPGLASAAVQRTVTPIVSASPQTDVLSSVVSLKVPLPSTAVAHPAACDWISYERWRSASGPSDPTQADAVVILQPGLVEGATAFDAVARNAIEDSAAAGKHIEVWGIDRRSNCLEDHTGTDAAIKAQNPEVAIDYYYRGKPVDGKTFGGFDPDDRVLGDLGVAQTVNDEYAILTNELPNQAWREKHVICGGHSLGGPITEIFAGWDFDGNPATTTDAGYRQCAGFFGFDTSLDGGSLVKGNTATSSLLSKFGAGVLKTASGATIAAIKSGLVPRHVDLIGINPESMNALEMISYLAEDHPDDEATKLVSEVPRDKHMEDFLHLAGSPDLGAYVNSKASVRNYRYTNMALFGQIMDDNGAAYGLVRSSFGYFDGAPLRTNLLPSQGANVPILGQLVTKGPLVMPIEQKNQQLSTWRNYDDLPAGAAGVTSPGEEVTDDIQFARAVNEGPLNLTENYFPIRLLLETSLLAQGNRNGTLANAIYPRATEKKPRFTVLAGGGVVVADGSKPVDPYVIAPGYQHLDVLTAAKKQNNGQPEISSTTLSDFTDANTGS